MSQQREPDPAGILLVDKPTGWTSHDVVNCVRRRFRLKKVGHCGTLDPNATGLLVLVLGKATKLSQNLMVADKAYEGIMRLGIETATQDAEGEVTAEHDTSNVAEKQIQEKFEEYTGDLLQTPPMVSAIKKGGKRLYEMARKGQTVEREPRPITIQRLKLKAFNPPDIEFELECSKGTYVRTICADIGRDLGCGAHLHALRRTASGSFNIRDAVTIDAIKSWEREELMEHMIPIEKIFAHL